MISSTPMLSTFLLKTRARSFPTSSRHLSRPIGIPPRPGGHDSGEQYVIDAIYGGHARNELFPVLGERHDYQRIDRRIAAPRRRIATLYLGIGMPISFDIRLLPSYGSAIVLDHLSLFAS